MGFRQVFDKKMHDIEDLQQKLLKMNVSFSVPLSFLVELMRLLNLFSNVSLDSRRVDFMLKITTSSIGTTAEEFNILSKLLVSISFRNSIYHSQNSIAFLLTSFLKVSVAHTMSRSKKVVDGAESMKLIGDTLLSLCNHISQETIYASVSAYVLIALFSSCATALRDVLLNKTNAQQVVDTSASIASESDGRFLERSLMTVLISVLSFDFSAEAYQAANGDNYMLQQWKVTTIYI